ncbi:hypothetical protein D3C72_1170560 [compost metagenome]
MPTEGFATVVASQRKYSRELDQVAFDRAFGDAVSRIQHFFEQFTAGDSRASGGQLVKQFPLAADGVAGADLGQLGLPCRGMGSGKRTQVDGLSPFLGVCFLGGKAMRWRDWRKMPRKRAGLSEDINLGRYA